MVKKKFFAKCKTSIDKDTIYLENLQILYYLDSHRNFN